MEPKKLAEILEEKPELPKGDEEKVNGYGVMGVTFSSGNVLALRRFTASSIGSAYTSIWFRNKAKEWRIICNIEPNLACPRYFGDDLVESIVDEILVNWTGDRSLQIKTKETGLNWEMNFKPTLISRGMNFMCGLVPDSLWHNNTVLTMMGFIAGPAFRAGKIRLQGKVPNRQYFLANPKLMWEVSDSIASLNDEDFSHPQPLNAQTRMGDFWIPQKGILAFGNSFFERFDNLRHLSITSKK